jgi:preprotein translocase subunit SecA
MSIGRVRDRVRRVLGRPGTIDLSHYRALLPRIEEREPRVRELTDDELTAAVTALPAPGGPAARGGRAARAARDERTEWLVELCALGREAARRGLDERPYDVQLLGTMALLDGHVIEMATGEGKTLAGAIAAAGFVRRGRRVHVVSVNDYLARRDAEWMGPVYDLLGVSVGWIGQESTTEERRAAYAEDVTYAPVSEIGFDVLRDRLCTDAAELVVPEPQVALVDEADSVFVDEARVPLVLAGAAAAGEADAEMAELVRGLRSGTDYEVDDDGRSVHLTDNGARAVEKALDVTDLYAADQVTTLTKVNIALHAHALLRRDIDYIVRDGKVQLVNESRGRVALLQRWPDGLQAAVEAKEDLAPTESGEVLDSMTVQALIRRYPTVCGMTGTAVAVAEQLREFYELEVAVIPTNRPCVRKDEPDRLYATIEEKEAALATEVASAHADGRPILLGTLDVKESERLARRLKVHGLSCVVLNAKNDAEEAAIIAEAGQSGAITVSTQMAGRGTDIRLGEGVPELGGLYVIGSGRYPSSRLDDQLRGRSGRQGDPGGTVFYTSLQDDLIVQYAPDARFPRLEGRVRDRRALWTVEHAQRVAEGSNLEIHRNTWRYSLLAERQRLVVLEYRDKVLRTDLASELLAERRPERHAEVTEAAGDAAVAGAARLILLYHLDRGWTDHLAFLADLREGIHLRALGRGLNPLDEFHREAVPVFNELLDTARERAAETFETVRITADGADLEGQGLRRPTATWTYVVHDNPFGTAIERAMRRMGSKLRGGITADGPRP